MNDKTELSALVRNLEVATQRYAEAAKVEAGAGRDRCSAMNDMNAAQRQLDQHVKKLREGAPTDSDWGLERRHRFAAKQESA